MKKIRWLRSLWIVAVIILAMVCQKNALAFDVGAGIMGITKKRVEKLDIKVSGGSTASAATTTTSSTTTTTTDQAVVNSAGSLIGTSLTSAFGGVKLGASPYESNLKPVTLSGTIPMNASYSVPAGGSVGISGNMTYTVTVSGLSSSGTYTYNLSVTLSSVKVSYQGVTYTISANLTATGSYQYSTPPLSYSGSFTVTGNMTISGGTISGTYPVSSTYSL